MIGLAGTRRTSNCLLFALGLRLALGGRIVRARSVNWSGPHFAWQGLGHQVDLVPISPRPKLLAPPLFAGVVRVRALPEEV